jgi:hypothetical protein
LRGARRHPELVADRFDARVAAGNPGRQCALNLQGETRAGRQSGEDFVGRAPRAPAARSDRACEDAGAAQLLLGHIPTLYARAGDWFAWVCVARLAAMLALSAT